MSKHQKELRRERRKVDRARRRGRLPAATKGAAALAAAAVIAAGTHAYASPLRFDNPGGEGHFQWFGTPPSNIFLDIMLPAESQTGVDHDFASEFRNHTGTGASLVRGSVTDVTAVQVIGSYGDAAPFDAGQLIPDPAFTWRPQGGYTYYSGYGSYLPEGQPTYLGLRFDPGDGWHYAWVGVVRGGPSVPGMEVYDVDAFAWGYETTPGVPIPAGIPEPGSLALLAFGALAVAGRRRA